MLVLENDHSSPVLEWMSRADAQGFTVETVRQPADGDWTAAVLEAIDRPGAPPVALASISSVHWSDGGAARPRADRRGAAAAGRGAAWSTPRTTPACSRSTCKPLDPDFLIFPTYKWVLGPYGRAFLYVAKRHQDGVPLEQTASGRRDVRAEDTVYFADTALRRRCAALRHGRARPLHLHGDGGDRHGDDGRVGHGGDRRAAGDADRPDRGRPCAISTCACPTRSSARRIS